jgi:hypothetical protein
MVVVGSRAKPRYPVCGPDTITPVTDITSIPLEEFASGLRVGMFTDEEIAEWIRGNPLTSIQKVVLIDAIAGLKGGPITGIIRTALREREGLPPVPGDDT